MESIIKEQSFYSADEPLLMVKLRNFYRKDFEVSEPCFCYAVYFSFSLLPIFHDKTVFLYLQMSKNQKELGFSNTFLEEAKDVKTMADLKFLLSTYRNSYIDKNKIIDPEFLAGIPKEIIDLLENSNGYLLYKKQAIKLYQLFKNCTDEEALLWVKNWNKKVPAAKSDANNLYVNGISLQRLIECLSPFNEHFFFISEPYQNLDLALEFIKSK
jgi:hypothetical protein